ncbi:hypothetical protein GCM10023350_28170 [Nocardioides endophyticus]|uniref:DUF3592 domain-containing protein n=1 Tax=Nocardioides endophyticus TaxID=1353775 RepID=A0ABP8YZG1_9ACTN
MIVEEAVAPAVPGRQLAWVFIAWTLVVICLVLLSTVLVAGERPTSYAALRTAVAGGRVDEIRVEGGLGEQIEGSASATVHWRGRLMGRVTSVTEATSRRDARVTGMKPPILDGRVDEKLTELAPDLRTTRSSDWSSYNEIGPWRVPQWTGAMTVVLYLGVLGLLVLGPKPWRATRWAWFWLLGSVPLVGALAFLLLGGSTWVLPPARPERRLTGGWAFLLSVAIHAAAGSVLAAVL